MKTHTPEYFPSPTSIATDEYSTFNVRPLLSCARAGAHAGGSAFNVQPLRVSPGKIEPLAECPGPVPAVPNVSMAYSIVVAT